MSIDKRTLRVEAKTKLDAGTYYIGDLCYVLNDEDYNRIVINAPATDGDNYATWGEDTNIFWHSTRWGDGCYTDQIGNIYGVDAGLIGIIPADQISRTDVKIEGQLLTNKLGIDLGHIHTFDEPFSVIYDNGTFNFGGVIIETGDDEDEE